MQNTPIKREARAMLFNNWTDEDFDWTWDGVNYHFPALQSMMMQDYLAEHFAKHLTDRELNKLGIPTNHFSRDTYYKKCFGTTEIKAENEQKLEQEILNTSTSEILTKSETIVKPVEEFVAEEVVKKQPDENGVYCQECGSRSPHLHRKTCSKYVQIKGKNATTK